MVLRHIDGICRKHASPGFIDHAKCRGGENGGEDAMRKSRLYFLGAGIVDGELGSCSAEATRRR